MSIYQEVQTNASLQTDKFWQSVAKIDKLRMWFHLDALKIQTTFIEDIQIGQR